MNALTIILFSALAIIAKTNEDCFDKDLIAEYEKAKDECKDAIPEESEDRIKKIGACVLKTDNLISEDGTLHYDAVREKYEATKARDLDHVLEKMDQCWEQANHQTAAFFDCWVPQLTALCPDINKWVEDY